MWSPMVIDGIRSFICPQSFYQVAQFHLTYRQSLFQKTLFHLTLLANILAVD